MVMNHFHSSALLADLSFNPSVTQVSKTVEAMSRLKKLWRQFQKQTFGANRLDRNTHGSCFLTLAPVGSSWACGDWPRKGHSFQNTSRGICRKSMGLCTPPRSITSWSFLSEANDAMVHGWEVFLQKYNGFYILNCWTIFAMSELAKWFATGGYSHF